MNVPPMGDTPVLLITVKTVPTGIASVPRHARAHRSYGEWACSRPGEQDETIAQLKSTVARQEATNAEQQKQIQSLMTSLKAQATQIQKVSNQLAAAQPTSRLVINN